MNEIEEREYVEQIEKLYANLNKRNEKIAFYQEKMEGLDDYQEIDRCIKALDKLLKECKLDKQLKDDLLNMLEVEHFLEFGSGVNFDPEY